jgi:MFS transporter, DHA1 family, inner membrane transport protein
VDGRSGDRGAGLATLLLAVGAAWSVGNVGAVVGDLSAEFGLSLTTVGLISGTLLLGFSLPGTLLSPLIAERFGIARTMIGAILIGAAGSALFALSPGIGGLLAGRAAVGFALGVIVVVGPVFARATGGVGRVALFGAGIQLGIAGGLGVGAALGDAGIEWRFTFLITAGVVLSPLPLLLARDEIRYERGGGTGFVRLALRSSCVWRLGSLFLAVFAVPLILGSWLVHYLSVDNGIAVGVAGALSFVMFGVSAAARVIGGRLAERDVSRVLLVSGAPFLAALGLVVLALDDSLGFAAPAVVACGIGFAVPYGIGVVQAQSLYPAEPTEPVAFVTLIGTAVPVPLVPLIGSLLDEGYGAEVFLGLAAIVALAGILNLRPVAGSLEPAVDPAPA